MKSGDLYRVYKASRSDPKRYRTFVVVSRQTLIDSRFSTVICAPVYSAYQGLATQVPVGIDEGLKHDSCISCDELVSIPKRALSRFVGTLPQNKLEKINLSLTIALALDKP